jgi:hypothetical protein
MSALRKLSLPAVSRETFWRPQLASSAQTVPQVCGKFPAILFDERGLASFFRQRFPDCPGFHVQAVTGIAAASVENWLQHRARPSAEHLCVLMCVFGPAFIRACVKQPPDWLDMACADQRRAEIDGDIARLSAERNELEGV